MLNQDNVWLRKDVADAQKELVLKQLADPLKFAPYFYFHEAMKHVKMVSGRILDCGSGVGHYGLFCEKHYPQWDYCGTDYSPAMIERARGLVPLGSFKTCSFFDNTFKAYDVVLVSQVMEHTPDPLEALDFVLLHTRGYLILHRVRLVKAYSHKIDEKTYLDIPTTNFEWNRRQFLKRLGSHILIPWMDGYQFTIVVTPDV